MTRPVAAALGGALALTLAAQVLAQNQPPAPRDQAPPRTISVTGTVATKTIPDPAVWSINLTETDKNLERAKERNDQRMQRVLDLRQELGLKEGDAETGHLNISREYERDEKGNQGAFKHFIVRRYVTLRQRDLKRFDEFLKKLLSDNEMEVGFTLESSRQAEVRAETRLKAVRAARDKAAAMADALGAKLGMPLTIDEHPTGAGRHGYGQPFPMNNAYMVDLGGPALADVSGGTFAPGAIEERVTIYVTFELR